MIPDTGLEVRGCGAAVTCEKPPGNSVTAVLQLRKYMCQYLQARDFAHLLHPPAPHPHPRCASTHCTLVHGQMHMILQGTSHLSDSLYPYLLGIVLTSRLLLSGSGTSTLAIVAMSPQRDSESSFCTEREQLLQALLVGS